MKIEVSDTGTQVSPPFQEVEFALILARMITTVKEDPVQMRIAVYEFARAKLRTDIEWADNAERERLMGALETAIKGVEDFSARRDQKEGLAPPDRPSQNSLRLQNLDAPRRPAAAINQIALAPARAALDVERPPPVVRRARRSRLNWVPPALTVVLITAVLCFLVYERRGSSPSIAPTLASRFPQLPRAEKAESPLDKPQEAKPAEKTEPIPAKSSPFPVPSVYGVYALNQGTITELHMLPEQVPDKRVAVSTPVGQPSRTVLPRGQIRFILYRRDLASYALDRVDIRVVAQVMRAIAFDAKGGRSITPVESAWNIRNIAYEFRVRPVPDNPEMVLLQPADETFEFAAGRYVIALRNQGYDFTVAGKISDRSQCLERTEASNGTFYSECEKL